MWLALAEPYLCSVLTRKICAAFKLVHMGFTTATSIMEQRKDNIRISTGCKEFDTVLEGACCTPLAHVQVLLRRLLHPVLMQGALRLDPLQRFMASSDVARHSFVTLYASSVRLALVDLHLENMACSCC